jgi:spore photoproduct lyase
MTVPHDAETMTIPLGYYAAGTEVEVRPQSSGVIDYFDRTPEGVVCPHFWRLSLGNWCRLGCAYCYLQGGIQHRIRKSEGRAQVPVVFGNLEGMRQKVTCWLETTEEPSMLNVGELSDSLDLSDYTEQVAMLIRLFAQQDRHRLLTLSKTDNVDHLLDLEHNGQTVMSWSINAGEAAAAYERNAPMPVKRIEAAAKVQEAGYPVRVRIDPMVPIREWDGAYRDLVYEMAEAGLRPERFTLGTLRFFPSVQPNAFEPKSAVFYAVTDHDDPDDRLRVPEDLRVRMYRVVRTAICDVFGEVPVGLCKETVAVRKAVDVTHNRCNCTL